MLSQDERRTLLDIARRSLSEAAAGATYRPPTDLPPTLLAPGAAFVTVRAWDGQLRGCIGQTEAVAPLAETVAQMAQAASQQDPRFPPVAPGEVDGLRVEISVLSQPEPIDPADIEVGRHGLVIERGVARGLLLPQVASERDWDRETFLDHTCLKAGLPAGAWREAGTRVLAFTAEVFGEDDE
ncbi:MAG: AmmeMemoRadiSam system protein A [Armatimonadia bacterium]|nr:AmmeMemoRadiSam system protein A [Armatimonadia bacterium]